MTRPQQYSYTSCWMTNAMLSLSVPFFAVGSHWMDVSWQLVLPAYPRSKQREETPLCTAEPWRKLQQCNLHGRVLHSGRISLSFPCNKRGEPPRNKPRPKRPLKVHVWAGISIGGPTAMCIFEKVECSAVCTNSGYYNYTCTSDIKCDCMYDLLPSRRVWVSFPSL